MNAIELCRLLTDDQLAAGLDRLAASDRTLSKDLLAHLAAFDERPAYRRNGCSSLYEYCARRLHFSEAVAYSRICAARSARRFPEILDLVERGELTLTNIIVIGPHLTKDNHAELLKKVCLKTRREVETLAASLAPGPAKRDFMARRPAPENTSVAPAGSATAQWPAPSLPAFDKMEALDGERRRIHFDIGPETTKLLERARAVMRHKFPLASFEDIVKEALKLLLKERDPALKLKLEKEDAKRVLTDGRRIPYWVRRKVWRRDGGRCSYIAPNGLRCESKSWLEFDHIKPYAIGGRSDDPENVRLLCRAHNQFEAVQAFGEGPPPNQESPQRGGMTTSNESF